MSVGFIDIEWRGQPARIEHEWIGSRRPHAPLLVFLHEGLGSRSMWKDFPQRLCEAADCRGLVYSRPGYGQSTPSASQDDFLPDYMHREAWEGLPALMQALCVDVPYWLFGHSDGGSIALLHAAHHPERVAGAIVLAPHIVVEELTVQSIDKARIAYLETDMPRRFAKYHAEADAVFWRWNRIWLHPAFRDWSTESELPSIRCPLLAMQGLDDEYGTLKQIHGIKRVLPQTRLLELPDCGHSGHRDQPERVIAAATDFIHRHN